MLLPGTVNGKRVAAVALHIVSRLAIVLIVEKISTACS
jgi:hypothetical protein